MPVANYLRLQISSRLLTDFVSKIVVFLLSNNMLDFNSIQDTNSGSNLSKSEIGFNSKLRAIINVTLF